MIEWIRVRSKKISKIAYNSEVKTMYIDFKGSNVDTPFMKVDENVFKMFCNAEDVDEFYRTKIKNSYQEAILNTENTINCRL